MAWCTPTGRAAGAVIFEHLYRFIRPFLIRPDDWINPESLFRQLQTTIDRFEHSPQLFSSDVIADCFTEIKYTYLDDTSDSQRYTGELALGELLKFGYNESNH